MKSPVMLWQVVILLLVFSGSVQAEQVLNWNDCVAEAEKGHPALISAREKIVQSRAARMQTQSGLLPQVAGTVSGERSGSKSPITSALSREDRYSYGISGRQLLFDGFKTFYDVQQAVKNIQAEEYGYEVVSSNVRLQLRTAFVGLLKAQQLLNITQDIVKRRQQSKELIRLRYEAGRENSGALLTAEANLLKAQFEVEQAKRNQDLAARRLSKEMGRTKELPIRVSGDFNITDKVSQRPDFEDMAETIPFLKELVVQKEAAKWGVNSATASFLPAVYASGSAGRTSSEWPPHGNEWSLGASLSVPLFEGGNLAATASKAQSQYRQMQADEKDGRDGVIFTLENTWVQFQDALGQVDVQQKFLEADRERSKIAEAQYSSGLVTFNDWIIIEDNLVNSEKSFLNTLAGALLAEAGWVQAKGETLDED